MAEGYAATLSSLMTPYPSRLMLRRSVCNFTLD